MALAVVFMRGGVVDVVSVDVGIVVSPRAFSVASMMRGSIEEEVCPRARRRW